MLELTEIFVPVDFSGASRTSLILARDLAERKRAQLRVVHAVPDILRYFERTLFPFAGIGDDRMEILAEVRKTARRDLIRFHHLQRGPKDKGTENPSEEGAEKSEKKRAPSPFEVDVLVGKASCASRVADRLAEATSELVVLARSGRDEVPAGRLGSMAASLCAASTRPVIVTSSIDNGPIKRVVIALDLSPQSTAVLRAGMEMSIVLGVPATLVVVAPSIGFGDVNGIVGRALRVDRKQVRSKVKREIAKVLDRFQQDLDLPFSAEDKLGGIEVARNILTGDPVEQLVAFVSEGESDLIVVGAGGQRDATLPRRLGRVAESTAANAPCHVMVVPAS